MNNACYETYYEVDIVGMINSWRIVKRAFIVAWSLFRLAEFREGRNRLSHVLRFLVTVIRATTSGSDLSAFYVSTWDGCASEALNHLFLRQTETHRRPQSSHSRTGFQPMRLAHISHLAVNSPLVKMSSNGFHPTSPGGERCGGETLPFDRLAPGFRSVKR